MKKIKYIILISLFAVSLTVAQVDTTDWFPMQTGNYWEYMAWTIMGPKYFSVKVIGDTLMPNNKEYKIFYKKYFDSSFDFVWYFRKDSNIVLSYTAISSLFPSGEFKYLDFIKPDSTIWLIIPIYNCCNPNSRGIASTFYDNTYYNFLQKSNEAKQFEDVYVDSADTIWTPSDGSFPIVLNRGLGIVWHFLFNDGSYYLKGAIINGVKMGIITDAQSEEKIIPEKFSLQVFPNPFNNTTNFKINIPTSDFTELSVYNILGQKIATLLQEFKSAGSYNIQFNANDISSGVYLVVLNQSNLMLKEKIILLK